MSQAPQPPSSENRNKKCRLDQWLVDHGYATSRTQAQALIIAGHVKVPNTKNPKSSQSIAPGVKIEVLSPPKYVSRGGEKLEAALKQFQIEVVGKPCLDIGASTGGFTDCLLQHGASQVYAVDVGYGQLAWKIRQHPQVVVMERTHVKTLDPQKLKPIPTLAVADVSFISLKKVFPHILRCLSPDPSAQVITLIKPQFEYLDYCKPEQFKGVVTAKADRHLILNGLIQDIHQHNPGWQLKQLMLSPLRGGEGNHEYLGLWQRNAVSSQPAEDLIKPLIEQLPN